MLNDLYYTIIVRVVSDLLRHLATKGDIIKMLQLVYYVAIFGLDSINKKLLFRM